MISKKTRFLLALFFINTLIIFTTFITGCKATGKKEEVSGEVKIDGSSTVYPITEAIAEEFSKENPNVRVSVGLSGTGGGFKKWLAGETDINNASRQIKEEEKQLAEKNGIEYLELKVAYDGITITINPENNWCDNLTVSELKKIWEPGSKVKMWSDIRPEFPKQKVVLFGPDTDSGTFDFFTEKILGKEGMSRSDYTASSDDNVLVQGVSGDKYSLGYFGFAYYEENKDKLKLVKVNGVAPSFDTIASGKYKPLSRELYLYVNKKSLERAEVKEFLKFYLENAPEIVKQVGYIPLQDKLYKEGIEKLEK